MATDIDTSSDDSSLCLGMACRRTLQKLDESSPWNWVGNIRFGSLPIHWGLVGSPQGEEQEESIRATKGYGTFSKSMKDSAFNLQK